MKPVGKPATQGVLLAVTAAEQSAGIVRRFLLKHLRRSPQDVEDLAQEVRLRLLGVSAETPVREPIAYIIRVAYSVLAQHAIAKRRWRHVQFDSTQVESETEGPPGDDPAYRLALRTELERALDSLSEMHRKVLLLHKRDGYSHRETAERLGLSEDQVRRYVVDAKAQVVAFLSSAEGEGK